MDAKVPEKRTNLWSRENSTRRDVVSPSILKRQNKKKEVTDIY